MFRRYDGPHAGCVVLNRPSTCSFEAPPAKQLETETATFLKWANASRGEPPLIKVGLAHLWFVTLHPFGGRNLKIVA